MGMLDQLAGDEPEEGFASGGKRGSSGGWAQRPKQTSTRRSKHQDQPTATPKGKPRDVSERTWGLAEHWLERGHAALRQRPAVSLPAFSTRLHQQIHASFDQGPQDVLATRGPDYVNEVVSRMIEFFWDSVQVGQGHHAALQFAFLADDWDGLRDMAETSIWVSYLKKHGKPVPAPTDDAERRERYEAAMGKIRIRRYLDEALAESEDSPPNGNTEVLNRFRKPIL